MGGVVPAWLVLAALTACGGNDASLPRTTPVQQASGDVGDKTVLFIEIEGTLAELAALKEIDGLDLERGASDLGGGRHKVGAMVTRKGTLLEVQARGLETRIVMDEAEAERRMQAERDEIERATGSRPTQPPPPEPRSN
jgi:hypothetical protein